MNTPKRLAGAVAAVAVVAVLGFTLVSRPGGVAGPGPTVGPRATPSTTPSPSPSLLPATGALDPGTYSIPEGPYAPARLTFTLPAGWATTQGFVYKGRGGPAPSMPPGSGYGDLALVTWPVSHVYGDVCHWKGTLVDAGTTVDELASLLLTQKSRVASAATDVTIGGYPAKRISLFVPRDLDVAGCDDGIIRFWPDPGPDESGGLCCSSVGSTDVVYVVDVPGRRFAVVARHEWDSIRADVTELDLIVASIQIEAPASNPSPGASSSAP